MPEPATLSSIVRPVPPDYSPRPGERIVLVQDNAVVQRTGLVDTLLGRQPERYCVAYGQTAEISGSLEGQELALDSGATAIVDLRYSRLRLLTDGHERLVLGLRGHSSMQDGLHQHLERLLGEAVLAASTRDPGQWARLRAELVTSIKQRVGTELGLSMNVAIEPAGGVPGPSEHGPLVWALPLRDLPQPVACTIYFRIAPAPGRIPVRWADKPQSIEDTVRSALEENARAFRLEDLRSAPVHARGGLQRAINQVLEPSARSVVGLQIEMQKVPVEQPRVRERFKVTIADLELELELDCVAQLRDAGTAVAFELAQRWPFASAVMDRVRMGVERRFATMGIHEVFSNAESARTAILDDLKLWLEAESGHMLVSASLKLLTQRPRPARTIPLRTEISVEPVRGRAVTIGIRAVLGLRSEETWLSARAPDIAARCCEELGDAARALLPSDEADVFRSERALSARLAEELGRAATALGYGVDSFSLRLDAERVDPRIGASARGVYTLSDDDQGWSLGASFQLELAEPLAYIATEPHAPGWADTLLDRVLREEMSGKRRRDLYLDLPTIESQVKARLAEEAGRHGYAIVHGSLLPPSLPRPPSYVRERAQVSVPLDNGLDEVGLDMIVEMRVADLEAWLTAGKPQAGDGIEERVRRALFAVLREIDPSDIDERPELVREQLRALLDADVRDLGYSVIGLSGRLVPTNRPPSAEQQTEILQCQVGQRMVAVSATVRLTLQSARKWRAGGVRDLQHWLKDNISAVVSEVLLAQPYESILSDVVRVHRGEEARVDALIEASLRERADSIGYAVTQVVTLPDKEAGELLEGFTLRFDGTFPTAWSHLPVTLNMFVTGRFASLEEDPVRQKLALGESAKDWLTMLAKRAVEAKLMEVTPNDVFFRWAPPMGQTRSELAWAVKEALAAVGVCAADFQATAVTPPYAEKVRGLIGGPYPFRFQLEARRHHGAERFEGSFNINGIAEAGADQLFQRPELPTVSHIADGLGQHLADHLDRTSMEDFLRQDGAGQDQRRAAMYSSVTEFAGPTYGLMVTLVTLKRKANTVENASALAGDLPYKQLETRVVVARAMLDQIQAAGQRGDWEEVHRLSAIPIHGALPPPDAAAPARPAVGAETASTIKGLFEPQDLTLRVDGPEGGYPSSEAESFLRLAVTLTLHSDGAQPFGEEAARGAVRATVADLLKATSPNRFWVRFDRPTREGPALSERLRDHVREAVRQHMPGHKVRKVDFERPESPHADLLSQLVDRRDIKVGPLRVKLQKIAPCSVSAHIAIAGVAAGQWQRFDRVKPDEEHVKKSVEEWIERSLTDRPRAEAAPRDWLDAFAKWIAEDLGLQATLRVTQWTLQAEEIEANQRELDELRARLRHLLKQPPSLYNEERIKEVRASIDRIEKHMAALTDPPAAAPGGSV